LVASALAAAKNVPYAEKPVFHVSLLFSTMSWNGVVKPAAWRAAAMRVKSRLVGHEGRELRDERRRRQLRDVDPPSLPVSLMSSAMSS
jgi:hypothetical protein